MIYAKINKNGSILTYPYTWDSLQEDNPSSAYDFTLDLKQTFDTTDSHIKSNEELVEVTVEDLSYNPLTEKYTRSETPVKIGNNYVLKYLVEQLPLEEASKRVNDNVRTKLVNSDWTQITDHSFNLTDSQKSIALQYRTELRDVSSQTGFPYEVTFPMEPDFMVAQPV
jgi:hypothetical protein